MKRLLLFGLFFIVQIGLAQTPIPILHFQFDGTLTDSSGNHTFTASTGATTNYVADRFGNVGKAYSTPVDINQRLGVEIPTLLPQGNNDRTVSFWVKMKPNLHWTNLVGYGDIYGTNLFGATTESNNLKIGTWITPNVFPEIPGQEHAQWGNVVYTYSQVEGTKAYYNGREVFSNSTINWNTAGDMLYLNFALVWNQYQNDFTLTYDDLKIYDVALSKAQVVENLINDSPLNSTNLVGYFDFENNLTDHINANLSFGTGGDFQAGHTTGSTAIEFNQNYNRFYNTTDLQNEIPDDNITLSFWRNRTGAILQIYETDIELFGSMFLRQRINGTFEMGIASGNSPGTFTIATIPASPLSTWEHITVVFKLVNGGRYMYLYKNGVLRGWTQLSNNTPMLKINNKVTIGTGTDSNGDNMAVKKANNLLMDNLYIFGRALTETEIMALAFQTPDNNLTQYTITPSANPAIGGSITGGGAYFDGNSVTLTATANTGYEFVRWTENGTEVSTANPYIFTANANRTLVAEFELIPSTQYTITTSASPSAGGTVNGGGVYDDGDTVTLTAIANAGHLFVRWLENEVEVSTANPYIFTANANRTLVAEFAPILNVNDVNTITLNVYPNPVSTILNVEVKESANIKIINLLGVTVATQKLNAGNNTIDVSNLEKGVYFLRTDKGKTVKFIKK